jgi:hypothetical protein
MFDPTHTAKQVAANWPAGIPQPAALAAAIRLFEESEWIVPPVVTFDASTCTLKNLAQRVEEHARQLALADHFPAAHRAARLALASNVIATAATAVPAVLDTLRPQFDEAAQDYVAAVAELPEKFDGDAIAIASPDVQAAYARAGDAARTIAGIRGWLGGLVDLPGQGGDRAHHLYALKPKDRNELSLILSQHRLSAAEQRIDGVLLVAARNGIEFTMSTPRQASDIESAINASPVVRKPLQFAKLTR